MKVQKAYSEVINFIDTRVRDMSKAEYLELLEEVSADLEGLIEAVKDEMEEGE